MKKTPLFALILITLVLGIFYLNSRPKLEMETTQPERKIIELTPNDSAENRMKTSEKIEPEDMLINFDLGIHDIDVKLEKNRLFEDFDRVAKQLEFNAQECGAAEDISYYEDFLQDFQGVISYQYGFTPKGDTQGVPTYWVTMHPNKRGYTTMEEFEKDFDICNPNRGKFPYRLNEKWLMMVSSCGAPFDDASGRPHGCALAKEVVEPTLDFAR